MKNVVALCMALLVCALAACGDQSAQRSARGKPRVAISSQNLMIYRAPAANAEITAEGVLKIDDIDVPQPPLTRAKLQLLFGQMQILRQQAVANAKYDPSQRSIRLTATPQIQRLQQEVFNQTAPLQPYRESFDNLQAERR